MHRYVAFLRGINLGKRRVKMDDLRALFVAQKFADVSTFIASGNVLFASRNADARQLEAQIEAALHKGLGYEVDTFVRTRDEVAAVAAYQAFPAEDAAHPDHTSYVGFLREALPSAQARGLVACATKVDVLHVAGREYYWLCRIKSNESTVWTSPQMRALKLPTATVRNLTTIRKLAALEA